MCALLDILQVFLKVAFMFDYFTHSLECICFTLLWLGFYLIMALQTHRAADFFIIRSLIYFLPQCLQWVGFGHIDDDVTVERFVTD